QGLDSGIQCVLSSWRFTNFCTLLVMGSSSSTSNHQLMERAASENCIKRIDGKIRRTQRSSSIKKIISAFKKPNVVRAFVDCSEKSFEEMRAELPKYRIKECYNEPVEEEEVLFYEPSVKKEEK